MPSDIVRLTYLLMDYFGSDFKQLRTFLNDEFLLLCYNYSFLQYC